MSKTFFNITKESILNVLMLLLITICGFSYAKDDTIFAKVMKSNLGSLALNEEVWPTEEYYMYIDRCMKNQSQLQEYKKRQVVFQLFDTWAKKNKRAESHICDDPVTWSDLNLFCGQSDLKSYLGNKIDRTQTIFGRMMLLTHLVQPSADLKELEQRQEIIKYLIDNPELLHELDTALKTIRDSENMFLSYWSKDELKEFARNYRFLEWPWKAVNDKINRSEMILTGMNAVMHNTNILWVNSCLIGATVMLPVSAAKLAGYKFSEDSNLVRKANDVNDELVGGFLINKLQKWTKDIITDDSTSAQILSGLGVLGGIYAGLSIKEWFNWTRAQFAVESCLHIKLIHVARVVEAVKKFHVTVNKHARMKGLLKLSTKIDKFLDLKLSSPDEARLKQYTANLYNKTIPEYHKMHTLAWYSLLSTLSLSKGKIFVNYNLMHENKECFEDTLAAIGEIDMYVSLAKLYKEGQHQPAQYSFVEFKQSNAPSIEIEDFWNPFIDPSKVVTNSLKLGVGAMPRNMIITGPNAGGKSTILKATAISMLMAQSFGLAPCRRMLITPFNKIITYLNIADDIGAGKSLFKAQALRAQKLLDDLHAMKDGEFGFMIVDEMFNGTNPTEAEASAFSVAQSLGEQSHGVCIIATHFSLLTHLGDETNNFTNCNVSIKHDDKGSISYPFKLCPGSSDQRVAIEILRAQGFDGSILDNAQAIIKESEDADEFVSSNTLRPTEQTEIETVAQ